MRTHLRFTCLVLAATTMVFAAENSPPPVSRPIRVGVVDHQLISQENWLKPWQADWESGRIVEQFKAKADIRHSEFAASAVVQTATDNVQRGGRVKRHATYGYRKS